ncbi:DUF4292 domain-containing protein [Polaribacter sp.]|nr:DUF4292 domain-containing protein [Polaribacter sp.]
MKSLKIAILSLVIIAVSSCKSSKNYTITDVVKPMSAKKIIKKHVASNVDKKTIDAKFKANFKNEKIDQSISVNLKIIKDEVIYLKGTKFITVFKAKITPDSISYYSPFAKNYFKGDFKLIKSILGTDINFNQLQNLLTGQAVENLKEQKYTASVAENVYELVPEFQNPLFDIFYSVNAQNFKLKQQSIIQKEKNQRLDVVYKSYKYIEEEYFPSEMSIEAKKEDKFTNITFELKSVVFDTEVALPFSIPNGYKEIKI